MQGPEGRVQAMAPNMGISLAILSSSKCSLAASQDENQKANSPRGVCGYGRCSCTPPGKLACTITFLKCFHTNTHSMGTTGRTGGLETCVQPQGHNLLAVAETWWDSSHDLDAVTHSYVPFRKDRPAKWGDGAAFYVRVELECVSASERITDELRGHEWKLRSRLIWVALLWEFATGQENCQSFATWSGKRSWLGCLQGAESTLMTKGPGGNGSLWNLLERWHDSVHTVQEAPAEHWW